MTDTTTANEALVRQMVGGFQTGDMATVASAFAPDAVWDFPGRSVLNGTYKGVDEILAFLGRAFELSGATFAVELLDVTASDRGATQLNSISADHDGRTLQATELLHHEVVDGRIVRTFHRSDDPAITGFFGAA